MRASLRIALLFVCAPVALRSQTPADTITATTADTIAATRAKLVPPRTVPPTHDSFKHCERNQAFGWGALGATFGAVGGALLGALPAVGLSLLKQHDAARAALWVPVGIVGTTGGLIGVGLGVANCMVEAENARWHAQHEAGERRLTPASPPRRTTHASTP
jgi:hypothetical protein